MRLHTLASIGFVAGLLALGCGKKGGTGEQGGAGGESGASASMGGMASKGGAKVEGGDAKKLTQQDLERLLKVEVPGFQQAPGAKVMDMMGPMVTVYYQGTQGNAQDMTAAAQVRIYTCGNCPLLTAESFKGQEALFEKMMLPAAHKDNKEAVFDIQEETLVGKKVVSIYQLSFVVSADGKSRASSHGYSVYLHDGKTMLHVMIYPKGFKGFKSTDSLEDLKKQLTRQEMVAAAKTFLETLGGKLF